MGRSIPVWFFLLVILIGLLGAVAFGFAVKRGVAGGGGTVGEIAVEIASFPELALRAVRESSDRVTGEYRTNNLVVAREPGADYSGFTPVETAPGIDLPGLMIRREGAGLAQGWRLLVGAFELNGAPENAALLLSPNLKVVHARTLDEIAIDGKEPNPPHAKFIHGVELLPDGSLIFAFDAGTSIQRIDACGERLWARGGFFHHAITLERDMQTAWVLEDRTALTEISVADGTRVRKIEMEDVIAANPEIDPLELRRKHTNDASINSRNTEGKWLPGRYHLNDVDPLPADLAPAFPGFEAGDLLLSSRSLNLVFVLDPDTLAIKWWRIGAVQRQHDPDWLASGEILVFNNRMSRDYSEIVSLDPATFERTVLLDGRAHDFYTRIRGKQQRLDDGTLVVSSPQQGRAFEVAADGTRTLDIVNLKPGDDSQNFVISELRWMPPVYISPETWPCAP